MSDEQLIVLVAAVLWSESPNAITTAEEAAKCARALFDANKKLGPLPTQALPELRKATISRPTIEERNEAHAARQYEKRRRG